MGAWVQVMARDFVSSVGSLPWLVDNGFKYKIRRDDDSYELYTNGLYEEVKKLGAVPFRLRRAGS